MEDCLWRELHPERKRKQAGCDAFETIRAQTYTKNKEKAGSGVPCQLQEDEITSNYFRKGDQCEFHSGFLPRDIRFRCAPRVGRKKSGCLQLLYVYIYIYICVFDLIVYIFIESCPINMFQSTFYPKLGITSDIYIYWWTCLSFVGFLHMIMSFSLSWKASPFLGDHRGPHSDIQYQTYAGCQVPSWQGRGFEFQRVRRSCALHGFSRGPSGVARAAAVDDDVWWLGCWTLFNICLLYIYIGIVLKPCYSNLVLRVCGKLLR